MAYEYDRLEREDSGSSFLMGLLAGTVLGAGLGMLFAPKAGSELRNQLGEQAGRLRTTAADGYQQATEKVSQGYQQATEKVSQIVDRGKEAYDRARAANTGSTSTGNIPGTTSTSGGTAPSNPGQFSGAGTSGYSTNRS